jgi:hypothetical protein
MQEQNLDINMVIQAFQEKVSQLTSECIVKEATIKQLSARIEELESKSDISAEKD